MRTPARAGARQRSYTRRLTFYGIKGAGLPGWPPILIEPRARSACLGSGAAPTSGRLALNPANRDALSTACLCACRNIVHVTRPGDIR
jgi:hypothetical protein